MPTILDEFGRPFAAESTQTTLSVVREQARQVQRRINARYDAAQTTEENSRHWANADALGPRSALDPAVRRALRIRARYEVANDPYASGMIATLANDTIGTGPSLQMLTENRSDNTHVETSFWRWCQDIRLPQKLRTMRRCKAVEGESFGAKFSNPRSRNPVRLDLRLFESDQIADPTWGPTSQQLTDGIILDDFDNVLGYTVLRVHPGESMISRQFGPLDYEIVPARDMIHYFKVDRPGQARGVPEITPALHLFAMRRRYSLAVLSAAEQAALVTWLLKTQQSPGVDPVAITPLDAIEAERNMGMALPEGWEMQQLKAEQPTTAFDAFQKAIIREMARCLNMPFNIAAGDSSTYNYASGRMDHQLHFKAVKVERSDIEQAILESLFRDWWREARLVPGQLPKSLLEERDPPAHSWYWDGHEHVDPLKEANAQKTRLDSNTTTLAEEFARQGKDWEEQLEQRAREQKKMRALGLLPVADGAGSPLPPPTDDEEADNEE